MYWFTSKFESWRCRIFLSYYDVVNRNNLVIHASDLPENKGWSPVAYAVLSGQNRITLTLIEAEEKIDAGDVYLKNY